MSYLASFRVLFPIDPPLLKQLHVSLEVVQQIGAWHCASCEEMRTHPAIFKIIRCILVGEKVHEKPTTRLQSAGNLGKQQLIILHVLKQLDGNDTIVVVRFEFVVHHISSNNIKINEAFGGGLRVNILLLGPGIRKGRDIGIGENFCKVQCCRAPSTPRRIFQQKVASLGNYGSGQDIPKIQHAHPVLKTSLLNISIKHCNLCLPKCFGSGGIKAAAILHSRPQASFQDAGSNFIMLLVGGRCLNGNRSTSEQTHVSHLIMISLLQRRMMND